MNATSPLSEKFHQILTHPAEGVVGLVDALFVLCNQHSLQLDWQHNEIRVRHALGDWEEVFDLPLRKSVFRAILARIAVLCKERSANAVSPYGGQGELLVTGSPPVLYQVNFTNTATEQRLQLWPKVGLPRNGPMAPSRSASPSEPLNPPS